MQRFALNIWAAVWSLIGIQQDRGELEVQRGTLSEIREMTYLRSRSNFYLKDRQLSSDPRGKHCIIYVLNLIHTKKKNVIVEKELILDKMCLLVAIFLKHAKTGE